MRPISRPGDDGTLQRIGCVGVWAGALGWAPAAAARAAAAEIERLGYGALWIGESLVGKEIFSHAGYLLAATERLVVGTGIANIWARDPITAHAAAATIGEAYPGRFVLGLGVSHAPQVTPRGHAYERPVTAMRAFLDAMDHAQYYAAMPPSPVPRVLAALGPRMLELARERSAGAHPYLVTPEHTARARDVLGNERMLVPEQAVVLETDPAIARARGRQHMRFYLALPNYVKNLRALGFAEADFSDGGSDKLIDALVAWGNPEVIRSRIQCHLDAGADHVAVQPLSEGRTFGLAQLRELAPSLLQCSAAPYSR